MSDNYKDYIKQQKEYIEAKKQAHQARVEKWLKPRDPNWGDPPPQGTSPLHLTIGALVVVGVFLVLISSMNAMLIPASNTDGLTLWIQGTEEETAQLQNWLLPQIKDNNLPWKIVAFQEIKELAASFQHSPPDLLLIGRTIASELYENGGLTPLQNKREVTSFTTCFAPLWEEKPWVRQLGWAIPNGENVEEARHLYTLVSLYAEPFVPR